MAHQITIINKRIMTPFNLSQALAGKPFTNEKGWTVEDWHYFKGAFYPVLVKFKDDTSPNYVHRFKESELFMLPEKKKVWIVVYKKSNGELTCIITEDSDNVIDLKSVICERHLETIEKEYEL